MRAVAMATPGMTFPLSLMLRATMPAAPPMKAMSTSKSVGEMRASSSDPASWKGETRKNRQAVRMLSRVATARWVKALRSRSRSLVPMASPMAMMGPMRGEMSMAPMMTAVEFTLSPREAMKVAKMRIQSDAPRKLALALMRCTVSCWLSRSCRM